MTTGCRAVPFGVSRRGGLMTARVTEAGAEVLPFGRRFTRARSTSHRLRFTRGGVLFGIAEGGVTVWTGRDRPPVTIRCFGVSSAAVSQDSTRVAVGTRRGGVALAGILSESPHRGHPGQTSGHDQPVHAVQFSTRGRWLATAGEQCWLWSW